MNSFSKNIQIINYAKIAKYSKNSLSYQVPKKISNREKAKEFVKNIKKPHILKKKIEIINEEKHKEDNQQLLNYYEQKHNEFKKKINNT